MNLFCVRLDEMMNRNKFLGICICIIFLQELCYIPYFFLLIGATWKTHRNSFGLQSVLF